MSAYRAIGGGKLGLARVADDFFENSLSNQEQEIAKRIFMWLVKPGQGMVEFVSKRVRKIDLYQIAAPQIVDPVLKKGTLVYPYEPKSWGPNEVEQVTPPGGSLVLSARTTYAGRLSHSRE